MHHALSSIIRNRRKCLSVPCFRSLPEYFPSVLFQILHRFLPQRSDKDTVRRYHCSSPLADRRMYSRSPYAHRLLTDIFGDHRRIRMRGIHHESADIFFRIKASISFLIQPACMDLQMKHPRSRSVSPYSVATQTSAGNSSVCLKIPPASCLPSFLQKSGPYSFPRILLASPCFPFDILCLRITHKYSGKHIHLSIPQLFQRHDAALLSVSANVLYKFRRPFPGTLCCIIRSQAFCR